MTTMKSVRTGEQNKIDVVDAERPSPGPKDALVRIRACGICGTDTHFLHLGGVPFGPGGSMVSLPLGHEPAGEVVEVGAGPIGLGATIWLKLRGVEHVVVADVIPERLRTALAVGADAVIDSAAEDVTARLTELHGPAANALGQPRAGTDIYIDAAGVPAVFNTTVESAKWGAKLVMVAVQKKSDAIDLGGMLRSELTLVASQGYPTEIFEVTPELVEHQELFARLISHRVPFSEVGRAYELAMTPGAAEKVVVTFEP
ncbi:zinc-binding dehydrogenase [Streptomyces sp. NPDC020480]|uniref:zinc-binding dehydrogenase n=1 Tax=Streptomyces sp. NPDC020480 TaxID=3365076 RepID=UPI0037B589B9